MTGSEVRRRQDWARSEWLWAEGGVEICDEDVREHEGGAKKRDPTMRETRYSGFSLKIGKLGKVSDDRGRGFRR